MNKLIILLTDNKETKINKKLERPIISLNKTLERFKNPIKEITLADLNHEVNNIKKEILNLKQEIPKLKLEIEQSKIELKMRIHDSSSDEEYAETSKNNDSEIILEDQGHSLKRLKDITIQKWYINVKLVIDKTFIIELPALIDSGADLNCIQEGLIPTSYYEKTNERLSSANGSQMDIKYKLPKVHICQDNVCFKTSFVLIIKI